MPVFAHNGAIVRDVVHCCVFYGPGTKCLYTRLAVCIASVDPVTAVEFLTINHALLDTLHNPLAPMDKTTEPKCTKHEQRTIGSWLKA